MLANKTAQNREREREKRGEKQKEKLVQYGSDCSTLPLYPSPSLSPVHHLPRLVLRQPAGRRAAGQTGKGTAGLVRAGPGWAQTVSLAF
ncbi:hypothetical protein QQF64_035129 [Cirrhinus molitorella]|uniref:Small EDRK-rich factor-like N-terminal domain-containing protein n=1 Tax=Cirrhinus molitorella TaxID=172907 RepID=A0ABR3NF98_9TELE